MNAMHYGLLAVLVLLGFYLASRYGMFKEGNPNYSTACHVCMRPYVGGDASCWGYYQCDFTPIFKGETWAGGGANGEQARKHCSGVCGYH